MTDPLESLALADPARDLAPGPAESTRMDAEWHRLLAMETPAGVAGDPRRGAAVAPPVGAAASRRASTARSPRRVRPRKRWLLAPAGLAAVLATLTLAIPDKAPVVLQPEPASASTVLSQLGRRVAQAPAPTGRYAYLKQLAYITHMRGGGKEGPYAVVIPHELEQWIDDDGHAVVREIVHEDQATFPTPEDKARYEAAGPGPSLDPPPYSTDDLTIAQLTYAQVQSLPTDPVQLRERLENTNVAVTARVGQLLSSAATPTPVKVALFEVLKSLPGAKLADDVTDPLGRTGVAVEFEDPAWHSLFLFDPATGALLGVRSIGHKELPGRDITDWNLTVDSKRVDTLPSTAH